MYPVRGRTWGVQAENLGESISLLQGSGKYFRNVKDDPEHNIGIVEINEAGSAWRIVWGLEGGVKPTSEFPSHFFESQCQEKRYRR